MKRRATTIRYKEQNYFQPDEPLRDDNVTTSDVLKLIGVKQMRVYDELRELDVEDNEASSR